MLERDALDGAADDHRADAGVVEHHVEPAEGPHGAGHRRRAVVGTAEVGDERRRLAAAGAHVRRGARQLGLAQVRERDSRPRSREEQGAGAADARRRARDQRTFPCSTLLSAICGCGSMC